MSYHFLPVLLRSLNSKSLTATRVVLAALLAAQFLNAGDVLQVKWRIAIREPQVIKGYQLPKWRSGHLLTLGPTDLVTIDRAGAVALKAPIALPGTMKLAFRTAVMGLTDQILITGNAISEQAAVAPFMAALTPNGSIQRVIRMSGFGIEDLALGQDGTAWVLGVEYDTAEMKPASNRDVSLLESALNWDSFRPYKVGDEDRSPAFKGFVQVSAAGIGVYSSMRQEWVELTSSGKETGRWAGLTLPTRMEVSGVGYTDAGEVFLSARVWGDPKTQIGHSRPTTPIYRLDKKQRQWRRVDTEPVTQSAVTIIGVDKNDVVVWSGPENIWAFNTK